MKKRMITVAALLIGTTLFAASTRDVDKRLEESAMVLKEVMDAPDKGIPEDLLDKAHCVVIVPGISISAMPASTTFTRCRWQRSDEATKRSPTSGDWSRADRRCTRCLGRRVR